MSDWKTGDRVRLVGKGWGRNEPVSEGLGPEMVVTLGALAHQMGDENEWEIEGTDWSVSDAPDSLWSGVKVDSDTEANSAGEVRSVSSTGGEKGVKPEEFALLPVEALEEIARVYGFGAKKYAANNWRKGYEWSKSFSAMMRHLWAFWKGEERDPESGLSHLAHAGFHVLGLLTFWIEKDRYSRFDDRYKG